MLVLVTTEITKIHGIHHWKDDMAYNKRNVEHHETNNSIYYTREIELHTESYAMLNRGMYCERSMT